MPFNIQDISFNLSNYCLGTCKYCHLWNPKYWRLDEEMRISDIERLFSDPTLDNLKTIHITGGSPFLSPKILPLVNILYEYHHDVPINSPISGLYPELMRRICKVIVKKLPQWRFNVAVEGPNRDVHESIRGDGSWEALLRTINILGELHANFRCNMTLYKENYRLITRTKQYVDSYIGKPLYINFGRFSRRFGNSTDAFMDYTPLQQVTDTIKIIEEQLEEMGWFKERLLNRQKWVLQKNAMLGKKVEFDCLMGQKSIDVNPYGDVYPCLMYPEHTKMGNLKYYGLTGILNEDNFFTRKALRWVKERKCQPCPFTCVLHVGDIFVDGEKTCVS